MLTGHIRRYFILMCLLPFMLMAQDLQDKPPLDLQLKNYAYPWPVHYINIDYQEQRLRMAYMDVAPDNANGAAIVLFHGKNFTGAYWRETIKALTGKGYRVIIPDQIGFGKSSKPVNIQYSFQWLSQNVKQLLDTLGIQHAAVLGHSMGGMLAVRFTLMNPQLVTKLVLEDPIGLEDWKLKVPYQSVDAWYASELKQTFGSLKKYQQENYYHGQWRTEYNEWLEVPVRWLKNADYRQLARNSALIYDMIFTQPVYYELGNIAPPVLLIIGQADKTAIGKNLVTEAVAKTMGNYSLLGRLAKQHMKRATLIELDGIGHVPHIEAFDRFIQPLFTFLQP